jgi:hypothetical protein
MDSLEYMGIPDSAPVLAPAPRVELLLVDGPAVVENGELRMADEAGISREIAAAASHWLARKAEEVAS